MAWAAVNNDISLGIVVLYISAIFWTLGYDTIYGAQDMSDDEIIGLKSTSIKFKDNIRMFVFTSYSITIILMLYLFKNYYEKVISLFFFIMFICSLFYQLLNLKNKSNYLKIFKFNNYTGLLMFLSICSINI